jgi:hypothetical protein
MIFTSSIYLEFNCYLEYRDVVESIFTNHMIYAIFTPGLEIGHFS